MGNFGRGGDFNKGGHKFGGGPRNRGFGDRARPAMHQATCDKCGRDCEVPFKPTGDRPVFCKDCFRKDSPTDSRKYGGRDGGRPSFEEKRMFEATCGRCGNRCEVPFRPSGEKPVFCRDCFGKKDGARAERNPDQYKAQFDILNSKLDRIMRLLASAQPQGDVVVEKAAEEAVEPRAKKAVGKKKALPAGRQAVKKSVKAGK